MKSFIMTILSLIFMPSMALAGNGSGTMGFVPTQDAQSDMVLALSAEHVLAGNGGGTMNFMRKLEPDFIVLSESASEGKISFVIVEVSRDDMSEYRILTEAESLPTALKSALRQSFESGRWVEVSK